MNSTSDPRDSARPTPADAGVGGHNSRQSTPSVLGSAVNTTPTPSTMATSSSCEMPASSAADSNSRLMENEMVNDRSDPRLESDSDIVAERYPSTAARRVTKRTLVDACRESVGFEIDARKQILACRRLLVAPRATRQPRAFRAGHRGARVSSYTCEAGIFGTTFANLSHICRDDLKVNIRLFRTALHEALMPTAKNFKHMSGPDVPHLARGLASHRVLRGQASRLLEVQVAPRIHQREGHAACAFGITASILVLFHVLARENDLPGRHTLERDGNLDAGGLGTQLEKLVHAAAGAFADWPLQDAIDAAALCAEQRALQRAYVGIRLARMCDAVDETPAKRFARRLDFYAQCAWPACDLEIGRETHHEMLDAIASGEIASDEWVREDNLFITPMVEETEVCPLSALHSDDARRHLGAGREHGADDYRDDDDASSFTLTTSPSTVASTAPSSAGDETASTADPLDAGVANDPGEALRVAQIAIAAATAVAGPLIAPVASVADPSSLPKNNRIF